MRKEAQKEITRNGRSSACCSTRASHGANTGTLVARAMPVPMPYAYSTFDSVTYSQNRPTIAKNCRRLKPPAWNCDHAASFALMKRETSAIRPRLRSTIPRSGDECVSWRDEFEALPQTRGGSRVSDAPDYHLPEENTDEHP